MSALRAVTRATAKLGWVIPAALRSRFVRSSLTVLQSQFELVPVTNEALAHEAGRIRYEVYCQEHQGYEDPANFPDHEERDAFDDRALQVLLRFKSQPIAIGTVRLVTPLTDDDFVHSYPTQTLCDDPLFQNKNYITRTCEVSRFCLSRERTKSLQQYLDPAMVSRIRPILKVGLLAGFLKTAQEHGFDRLCGVLEPWLIDRLGSVGFHFNKVGSLVHFHGNRQPCEGSVTEALEGMKRKCPEMWDYIVSMPPLWGRSDMQVLN